MDAYTTILLGISVWLYQPPIFNNVLFTITPIWLNFKSLAFHRRERTKFSLVDQDYILIKLKLMIKKLRIERAFR